jgi:hypothetical protein
VLCVAVCLLTVSTLVAQEAAFPRMVFDPRPVLDRDFAEELSGELRKLDEPSLYALRLDKSVEVYRFLWSRSFHHLVSVRLEVLADHSGRLVIRTAPGAAGFPYTNKGPASSVTRLIPREKVESFLKLLENTGFWITPPYEFNDQTGTDGSGWVIEGVQSGQYHLISRWTPCESNGAGKATVCQLGSALALTLGQLSIDKKDVY